MRAHLKPILTVMLLTPILTELLSNNLAPSVFFNPFVFILLATICYGFPILLLREFAIRRRMGIPGLLCLGLVYGIINEGILAKTFYLAKNVPLNTFDGYGWTWGIEVPWAVTISVWHSVHALLYPILLTYFFFPEHREQGWLNRKSAIALAAPTCLIATLIFFTRGKGREPGQLSHFIVMLAAMGLLLWIAPRLPTGPRLTGARSFRVKPILCGAGCFLALVFIPIVLSSAKVPVALFYGYFLLAGALIFRWLAKQNELPLTTVLLFALGDELLVVTFGILGAIGQASIQKLIADVFFIAAFIALTVRLRDAAGRTDEAFSRV